MKIARHGICCIANDLQYVNHINRCLHRRLHAATGVLSLVVWLFMIAAEAYTPLHAWLHGGSIPDDDDCAIAALTHGKVETSVSIAPPVVPVAWIESASCVGFSAFHSAITFLPNGRAPPFFSSSHRRESLGDTDSPATGVRISDSLAAGWRIWKAP